MNVNLDDMNWDFFISTLSDKAVRGIFKASQKERKKRNNIWKSFVNSEAIPHDAYIYMRDGKQHVSSVPIKGGVSVEILRKYLKDHPKLVDLQLEEYL